MYASVCVWRSRTTLLGRNMYSTRPPKNPPSLPPSLEGEEKESKSNPTLVILTSFSRF